jgi:hypothetical protein
MDKPLFSLVRKKEQTRGQLLSLTCDTLINEAWSTKQVQSSKVVSLSIILSTADEFEMSHQLWKISLKKIFQRGVYLKPSGRKGKFMPQRGFTTRFIQLNSKFKI